VTIHGVEGGGEGHAGDGARQEGHEHKLLLQVNFVVRSRVDVGRDGQEEQESCCNDSVEIKGR